MKGIAFTLLTIVTILIPFRSVAVVQGFYDQRYRGWLWFEDKEQKEEGLLDNQNSISPYKAQVEIEQFSRELEELKFVMLARPTFENVRNYREKEKEMWDKAMILQESWDMANFIYPEQRDQINNPDNVHAVKLKRKLEQEKEDQNIREFAKEFELVAFFKNNCRYCYEFAPVLRSFIQEFGFIAETVLLDDPAALSKNSYLIKKLNIEAAPTIFVISKDGKMAFELVRGFMSLSELKSAVTMAKKYLESHSFKRSSENVQ